MVEFNIWIQNKYTSFSVAGYHSNAFFDAYTLLVHITKIQFKMEKLSSNDR